MPDEHARLSGSKMTIWENCSGAATLWDRIPTIEEPSDYAAEGTLAHSVAECLLSGDHATVEEYEEVNGVSLPLDMKESVDFYIQYVDALYEAGEIFVERRVNFDCIGRPDLFGTVDCMLVGNNQLHVIDYKHGAGVPVSIGEEFRPNRQLMYYLLAEVLDTGSTLNLTFEELYSGFYRNGVFIHIVQPRVATRVQTLEVSWEMLDVFYQEFLKAVRLTEEQDDVVTDKLTLKAGPWCRWCKVKDQCPEFINHHVQESIADFEVISQTNDVNCLDSLQLSELLLKAEKVEKTIRLLRNLAEAKLKSGEDILGYELVPKRGTRKWANEDQVIQHLNSAGLDPLKYLSLPSPNALLKNIPPAIRRYLSEELVVSESTGLRLGKYGESKS